MRRHTWNALLLIGAILLFCYGIWQHDLACGGAVWGSGAWQQPFYFWLPYLGTNVGMAYDLTLAMMVIGFVFSILALWFWND